MSGGPSDAQKTRLRTQEDVLDGERILVSVDAPSSWLLKHLRRFEFVQDLKADRRRVPELDAAVRVPGKGGGDAGIS